MRMSFFALAALVAGFGALATPATAAPTYPWCFRLSSTGSECSFNTFAQCLETLSGIGGGCTSNPSFTPSAAASPAYAHAPLRHAKRRHVR
jgi:Protein of unknown function (DUF3551)